MVRLLSNQPCTWVLPGRLHFSSERGKGCPNVTSLIIETSTISFIPETQLLIMLIIRSARQTGGETGKASNASHGVPYFHDLLFFLVPHLAPWPFSAPSSGLTSLRTHSIFGFRLSISIYLISGLITNPTTLYLYPAHRLTVLSVLWRWHRNVGFRHTKKNALARSCRRES